MMICAIQCQTLFSQTKHKILVILQDKSNQLTDQVPKQYDLQVFAQDYRLYPSVPLISERHVAIDVDYSHGFESNDQYHENKNHSLSDVSKRKFSLSMNDLDEQYSLHLNNP